jgi:hypothetical protein
MRLPSWALRYQIPVGFGGFHVALLGGPLPEFVVVYDCGSLMQQVASDWAVRIGRDIDRHCSQVDLAVLSHTDFDHVCGIESLAKNVHIETLMLPWLSLDYRTTQEAALARSKPSWYRRFIEDPLVWAHERSIRDVVFVDSASNDGEERPFERAPEQTGPRQSDRPSLIRGRTARLEGRETVVSSGDAQRIQWNGQDYWDIVPIVAPPRDPSGLVAALQAESAGKSLSAFAAGLSQRKRNSLRNRLARVYRRHWSNTNRSSVMLLVAPRSGGGGWLCTGDADLTAVETQQRLQRHRSLFASVDAVHVPHHGSPHNLDASAVRFIHGLTSTGAVRWIVSSGKNQWKYPHRAVQAACGQLEGPVLASCRSSDIIRF